MVNVGGPSKGCLTCISRKIRCDRQRPCCGQCEKSRRQCNGYRSDIDLVFRDQSSMIKRRHGRPTNEASCTVQNSQLKRETQHPDDCGLTLHTPNLEQDNSLVIFFSNNYTYNKFNLGQSMFWVPDDFADLLKYDATRLSVQAAGAMSLAQLQRSPYFFREAQKNYGNALLSLASTCRQDAAVANHAILLTVQFLGFFEVLAAFQNSRSSWVTHLEGLGAMLGRTPEQFLSTQLGARMLLQSRSQAIVNALQTRKPVPNVFQQPQQIVPGSLPSHVFRSDTADWLLMRLAGLQAQRHSSGLSEELLAELTILDVDLGCWMEETDPQWSFSRHLNRHASGMWWNARCDIYPTPIVAHVWNKIRAARIVACDLLQEGTLRPSPSRSSHDDNTTTTEDLDAVTAEMVVDICATVPLYWRSTRLPVDANEAETPPPLGTAYFGLYPLEVVGSMAQASWDLRDWVIATLERIHATTGTINALRVAKKVREKRDALVCGLGAYSHAAG